MVELKCLVTLFQIAVSVLFDLGVVARSQVRPQPIWNSTHTDQLRRDLLLNYDKFARPAQHYNVTRVKLGLTIRHVEVNEFKSTLTVYSWFKMSWDDEKLRWDPSKYGDINILNLADHELWQPDIFLYNSATGTSVSHYNSHCIVYSNGNVLWVPPAQFAVLCNLNLKYWPFDWQHCTLKFGSWTYSGDQIDLEIFNNSSGGGVELDMLIENSEWKIRSASIVKNVTYYACCKEPYPDVSVDIILDRISPSYKAVIVTPVVVIVFLILLTFWLPPNAGEKIILNGCTAIVVCLFMLYFTQKMPAMGTHTPLIVLFYSSCLYIVAFSTISSVIVITISRSKHANALPWVIKQRLMGNFGKYLGLTTYIRQSSISVHRVTAEEMRDHQVTDFDDVHVGEEHGIVRSLHSEKMPHQEDWILLAAAIDKISFVAYSLLFAILAIVYSV
ncbi:acetylcholine receptor subunit alpha-type acr-16-like isoform X2 [Sitophilus oryzae]|uniref:Acetylcholine receptor subunit alpha-type acr-16-like isoform X2 n=1 Tax=Sitophilus oryzae TaxID=7048 RepID=A0A6J2YVD3_SITOR|nr:acetylcholine receptor subunit alpha-type acr-16-like isoform X2 [Sitophilus oryzae]